MGDKGLKSMDYDELVKEAEEIAESLVQKGAKTSQLRKFHSHITKIWEMVRLRNHIKDDELSKLKNQVAMLKPMIYYVDARFRKKENGKSISIYGELRQVLENFVDEISELEGMNLVKNIEKLKHFYDSLIAYFLFYEKEKNQK